MLCLSSLCLSLCVACILKAMINRRLASVRLCQSVVYASVVCLRDELFVCGLSISHAHARPVWDGVRSFIHSLFRSSTRAHRVCCRTAATHGHVARCALVCGQARLRDRISVFTRLSRLHGRRRCTVTINSAPLPVRNSRNWWPRLYVHYGPFHTCTEDARTCSRPLRRFTRFRSRIRCYATYAVSFSIVVSSTKWPIMCLVGLRNLLYINYIKKPFTVA